MKHVYQPGYFRRWRRVRGRTRLRVIVRQTCRGLFWFLVVAVLLLGHFKQRDSYRCSLCYSMEHRFQWRFGGWMTTSVPLSPRWNRLVRSRLLDDFVPPHEHDWGFRQGSPYHFFGTSWGGCALGSPSTNQFAELYEDSGSFRALLAAEITRGVLSVEEVVAMAQLINFYEGDAEPPGGHEARASEFMDRWYESEPFSEAR